MKNQEPQRTMNKKTLPRINIIEELPHPKDGCLYDICLTSHRIAPDNCLYSVSTLPLSEGVFIVVIPALSHQCILFVQAGEGKGDAYNFLFISSIAKLRKPTCGVDGKGCLTPGFLSFKQDTETGWGFNWPP